MIDCNNSRVLIEQWRKLCESNDRVPCKKCKAYRFCPQGVPSESIIKVIQKYADQTADQETDPSK